MINYGAARGPQAFAPAGLVADPQMAGCLPGAHCPKSKHRAGDPVPTRKGERVFEKLVPFYQASLVPILAGRSGAAGPPAGLPAGIANIISYYKRLSPGVFRGSQKLTPGGCPALAKKEKRVE